MTDWSRVLVAGWPQLVGTRGWTMRDNDPATLVYDDPADAVPLAELEAKAGELEPQFAAEDERRTAVKAFAARYTYDDLYQALHAADQAVIAEISADAAKAARGERLEPKPATEVERAAAALRGQ